MARITTNKATYRIRGPWSAKQLRDQHKSYEDKYGTINFDRWLVERGKVYFKERR